MQAEQRGKESTYVCLQVAWQEGRFLERQGMCPWCPGHSWSWNTLHAFCLRLCQAHSDYPWGRPKSSEVTPCLPGEQTSAKEGRQQGGQRVNTPFPSPLASQRGHFPLKSPVPESQVSTMGTTPSHPCQCYWDKTPKGNPAVTSWPQEPELPRR